MRSVLTIPIAIIVISTAVSLAHAQRATEQFTPLGKSPGISGVSSYIGEIADVDAANRTISIAGDQESWSVEITEKTNIWLDRSKYKATNVVGAFDDLQAGRQVEVKPEDDQPQRAEWIKIVPESGQ